MARKVGFFHNGSKASFDKHYRAFEARMQQSSAAKDFEIIAK